MFAYLHSSVVINGSVRVGDAIPHEALSRGLGKGFCSCSLELSVNAMENPSGRECLINGNAASQMRFS